MRIVRNALAMITLGAIASLAAGLLAARWALSTDQPDPNLDEV